MRHNCPITLHPKVDDEGGGWVAVKNVQDVKYTYSLLFDKMAKERKERKCKLGMSGGACHLTDN